MSDADGMRARTTTMWVIFLAGPIIWFVHFMVVYVAAETGCKLVEFDFAALGLPGVSAFTVVATVVAEVAIGYFTVRALQRWRRSDGDSLSRKMDFAGLLLGAFSFVAVLAVGLPAVVLQPC